MSALRSRSKSPDWLATDHEDHEPQRGRQTQQQTVPSQDSCCCTKMEEKKEETEEGCAFSHGASWGRGCTSRCGSDQGFPPTSCTGHRETKASKDSLIDAQGLSPLTVLSSSGARSQPRQKTRRSLDVEHQLEQLMSEKDRLFTIKCFQLQCYIHPLMTILTRLRSGRYKHRLSGFQQSVAIDRIQRIMGVLRNPHMGERYASIMAKMEEMLRSWFPNVTPAQQWDILTNHTEETTSPNKKHKSDAPMPSTSFSLDAVNITVTPPDDGATSLTSSGPFSTHATILKWLHTSLIYSPGEIHIPVHNGPGLNKELTQDSAVSSSTDRDGQYRPDSPPPTPCHTRPRPPLRGKIRAPCLERLLRSTESIVTRKGQGEGQSVTRSSCS